MYGRCTIRMYHSGLTGLVGLLTSLISGLGLEMFGVVSGPVLKIRAMTSRAPKAQEAPGETKRPIRRRSRGPRRLQEAP